MEENPRPLTRADVAPATLRALELVARGFDVTQGMAEVVLIFQDGLFEAAWLKRRITLKRLDEFEPVFREAAATTEPTGSARVVRSD
jgi:hypothetical protein